MSIRRHVLDLTAAAVRKAKDSRKKPTENEEQS